MRTWRHVTALASASLVLVWFFLLRPTFLDGPASYIVVSGVSMLPTLHTGDLAIVIRQDEYRVGDVVAYRTQQGNVIHRIVGGTAAAGFIVQGDNKNAPDPWQPKPADILGRMWWYVPGLGNWMVWLRQPPVAGALVGMVALIALVGGRNVQQRRRGRRMATTEKQTSLDWLPASPGQILAIAVLLLLGLGLTGGAILLFRQPLTASRYVERLRYEHAAAFEYTVKMEPSILYPQGVLGPVLPSPSTTPATTAPPIYSKLARTMEVGFTYTLTASAPPDVKGEVSADLEISAGKDGWHKSSLILPPTAFSGSTASARMTIDFSEAWVLIDTIEKETGVTSGAYDIAIHPHVHVLGRLGSEPIDEVYEPTFKLTLSRSVITPDANLIQSQPKQRGDTVIAPAAVLLGPLHLPVETGRWGSASLAALCLLGASLLAGQVYASLNRDEIARTRVRHGTLFITVEQAFLKSQRIEVASMEDLAHLADRDGRVILDQEREPGTHVYFVHDGDLVYTYTAPKARAEG